MHDSLAGPTECIDLHGFSQGEIVGVREQFVDRLLTGDRFLGQRSDETRADYLARACSGGYPRALARPVGRRRSAWFDNYLRLIFERDAPDISGLQRLRELPRLLRLLAARNAGELNFASLANDAGLPVRTLDPYLDLLETLFLVTGCLRGRPNLSQRVVSRPANAPGRTRMPGWSTTETATEQRSTSSSRPMTDASPRSR